MEFQNVTFNLGGRVRYDTLEGREHLVVPTVMIVEGVLTGNNGPLLYPRDELGTAPGIWDHKPIVINHPEGTACAPDVLNARKVGVILNTKWNAPKLQTEAWIDIKRCKQLDNRILERLQNGQKVEVSTGLFIEMDRMDGQWRGKKFDAIARNYRPDHLAVLPDGIGACSIADGAGMLQNTLTLNEAAIADWFRRQLAILNGPPMFLPEYQLEMERKCGGAWGPPLPQSVLATLPVSNQTQWDDGEVYGPPTLNFDNPLEPQSEQSVASVEQPAPAMHHFGLNYFGQQNSLPNYFGQQGSYPHQDPIEDEEVYLPPAWNFDNPLAPKREQSVARDDEGEEGVEYYPAPVMTFANPLKPE